MKYAALATLALLLALLYWTDVNSEMNCLELGNTPAQCAKLKY